MNLSMTNTTERYYNQAILSFIARVVVMVGLPATIAVARESIGSLEVTSPNGLTYCISTLGLIAISVIVLNSTSLTEYYPLFGFVISKICGILYIFARLSFRVTRCVGTMALLAQIQMTVFHPCVLIKLRQRFWALANAACFGYLGHRHDCYSVNDYCLEPIAGHIPVVGSSHCTSIIHKINRKEEEL